MIPPFQFEPLRPFCHLPGISALLPGTSYEVQCFPTRLKLYHLKQSHPVFQSTCQMHLKGPVHPFTVCQDLERGRLTLSGQTAEGWFLYHLLPTADGTGIVLHLIRAPGGQLVCEGEKGTITLSEGERIEWMKSGNGPSTLLPFQQGSLSLGNHKQQDWEAIRRRASLTELLPLWQRAASWVMPPLLRPDSNGGTLALLHACEATVASGHPERTDRHWQQLVRVAFRGLLVPQLDDVYYQGVVPPLSNTQEEHGSPLWLLIEGAQALQQLFIDQRDDCIAILPHLLPSLPYGRWSQVRLKGGRGEISFEWTKKTLRRLFLTAHTEGTLSLQLGPHIRHYRLQRMGMTHRERRVAQTPLPLEAGMTYLLDRFES